MSLADELRTAGIDVIEGRRARRGFPTASGIDVELTGTGQGVEGADDINTLGLIDRALAYVQRSGRVWVFARGPLNPGPVVIVAAAHREMNETQTDVIDALKAILLDHIQIVDSSATTEEGDEE